MLKLFLINLDRNPYFSEHYNGDYKERKHYLLLDSKFIVSKDENDRDN